MLSRWLQSYQLIASTCMLLLDCVLQPACQCIFYMPMHALCHAVCATHLPRLCISPAMFVMQATQVRKSNYVREKGVAYDPDKHRTCTVYAGTLVQQVTRTAGTETEQMQSAYLPWL